METRAKSPICIACKRRHGKRCPKATAEAEQLKAAHRHALRVSEYLRRTYQSDSERERRAYEAEEFMEMVRSAKHA